jgi:hypothetical protein
LAAPRRRRRRDRAGPLLMLRPRAPSRTGCGLPVSDRTGSPGTAHTTGEGRPRATRGANARRPAPRPPSITPRARGRGARLHGDRRKPADQARSDREPCRRRAGPHPRPCPATARPDAPPRRPGEATAHRRSSRRPAKRHRSAHHTRIGPARCTVRQRARRPGSRPPSTSRCRSASSARAPPDSGRAPRRTSGSLGHLTIGFGPLRRPARLPATQGPGP